MELLPPAPQTERSPEHFRALHVWGSLYRDPDVLTDPAKRRLMLDARRIYQDTAMAGVLALRPASEPDAAPSAGAA